MCYKRSLLFTKHNQEIRDSKNSNHIKAEVRGGHLVCVESENQMPL